MNLQFYYVIDTKLQNAPINSKNESYSPTKHIILCESIDTFQM